MKEKIKFPSLLNKYLAYSFKNFIPLMTTIEITQSCNFSCSHCYNFDRTGPMPEHLKHNQLKPTEILSIIDQLAQAGALYLNFSGGEPLTNPHLESYVRRARALHLEPRLKTNGALLTSLRCENLMAAGLGGMDVSLYGLTNKTYESFTKNAEGLSLSLAGILNAKKVGLDVQVSLILHRDNIHELDAMIQFCKINDLPFQISIEITKSYDGGVKSKAVEITKEQFADLLQGPYKHFFQYDNSEKAFQCSCARSVCGISSTGDVFPCIGSPIKSGNLREHSFSEIWNNSKELNQIRGLTTASFKDCNSCTVAQNCNRSSGTIYVNTGDYTGCDEKTLEQAKLRQIYFS